MSSKKYLEKNIDELYTLLEDSLTGGANFNNVNNKYEKLRYRLSTFASILGPLPDFVNNSNTLWDLWNIYIKGELTGYESRRKFLKVQYRDYYDNLLKRIGTKTFEQELMFRDIAIESKIGEGGFAVVYKAEHIVLEEPRAVKKLEPIFANEENEIKALKRFVRETRILSKLNHLNIIKIYDAGIAGENPYIIMEYAEGKDLEKWIAENGKFEEEIALEIMEQMLSAMAAAHNSEVIHRDIKPKNIMWNGQTAIVLDFGAGQWLEHTLSTRMTTAPIGTYGYIANELFHNPRLLNKNLDCFSAGVLFHYILTSRLPNSGDPTYYLTGIRPEIINFIKQSISPPEIRFNDGQEMLLALRNIK